MKRSRFSEAQIVGILRQQEQGQTVAQTCREHTSSEATFYAWKNKFGGMSTSERLRDGVLPPSADAGPTFERVMC